MVMPFRGRNTSGELFRPIGYSVGRFVQCAVMFAASDFLHNADRRVTTFAAVCLAFSAAAFLTLQQSWSAARTLSRRQVSVVLLNGVLVYVTFALSSVSLKRLGPLPSAVLEFANTGIPFLSALLLGGAMGGDKKRGVMAMVAAYVIIFFTAPASVHDRVAASSAAATAATASAPPLATSALAAVDPTLLATTASAALNGTDASGAPVHAYHVLLWNVLEARVGVVAALVGGALEIYRTRYVKRASLKDFRGKKRLHALSVAVAALLAAPIALAVRFMELAGAPPTPADVAAVAATVGAGIVDPAAAATAGAAVVAPAGSVAGGLLGGAAEAGGALSYGAYIWSVALIALFYVVLKFYLDAQVFAAPGDDSSSAVIGGSATAGAAAARQMSTQFHFAVVLCSSCFIDWYRGEQGLTIPTLCAAFVVYFGLHNLLSSTSFLPIYTVDPASAGATLPTHSLTSDHRPASSLLLNGGDANGRASLAPSAAGGGGGTLHRFSLQQMRMILRHIMEQRSTRRIFLFLCINFAFMFVELLFGLWTNSLGLISDAGHMLFDCTALGIGLYASYISTLQEDSVYTYGYARYKVLSGFVNGVLLLYIAFFVFIEAIERIFEPQEITGDRLVLVSCLGLGVNLIGLGFFSDVGHGHSHGGGGGHGHSHGGGHSHAHGPSAAADHGHSHGGAACGGHGGHGSDHDLEAANAEAAAAHAQSLNDRGVWLHMLGDALGSCGVILSSFLVTQFGWVWADPVCSLIISGMIAYFVQSLIYETAAILLHQTPVERLDPLRACLVRIQQIEGVVEYRHPRFWAHSEDKLIGTLHVIVNDRADHQQVLRRVCAYLKEAPTSVQHVTVQIESQSSANSSGGAGAGLGDYSWSGGGGGGSGGSLTSYSPTHSSSSSSSSHHHAPAATASSYPSISSHAYVPASTATTPAAAAAAVAAAAPATPSLGPQQSADGHVAVPSSLLRAQQASSLLLSDPLHLLHQPSAPAATAAAPAAAAALPAAASSSAASSMASSVLLQDNGLSAAAVLDQYIIGSSSSSTAVPSPSPAGAAAAGARAEP